MYEKYRKYTKSNIKTDIQHNDSEVGETLEMKFRRILQNKEPITDGSPLLYTNRKDGVLPQYNVRTDRFDAAIEAMDLRSKNQLAKRQKRVEEAMEKSKAKTDTGKTEPKNSGEPGSSQATN